MIKNRTTALKSCKSEPLLKPTTKEKPKRKAASNGKAFERKIAHELREIFDPEDLTAALRCVEKPLRSALLKKSSVQRGQQSRGAHEPDVMTPSDWWLELQWAGKAAFNPHKKLEQAVKDVLDQTDPKWSRPAAICQLKGTHTPIVRLYLGDLLRSYRVSVQSAVINIPITIEFPYFLELLRDERLSD